MIKLLMYVIMTTTIRGLENNIYSNYAICMKLTVVFFVAQHYVIFAVSCMVAQFLDFTIYVIVRLFLYMMMTVAASL